MNRCNWAQNTLLEQEYHDKEWAIPIYDDKKIFEILILEINQAGLSWLTILKKRSNFNEAFDNFNYYKIAKYNENKILDLMNNPKIIRNNLKIAATISNAKAFINIQKEYKSFSNFIWGFVNYKIINNSVENRKEFLTYSQLSIDISKILKKKGFKFLGKTIVYSFLEAIGIINNHENKCDWK